MTDAPVSDFIEVFTGTGLDSRRDLMVRWVRGTLTAWMPQHAAPHRLGRHCSTHSRPHRRRRSRRFGGDSEAPRRGFVGAQAVDRPSISAAERSGPSVGHAGVCDSSIVAALRDAGSRNRRREKHWASIPLAARAGQVPERL